MDFKPIRIIFGYNKSVTAKRNKGTMTYYVNNSVRFCAICFKKQRTHIVLKVNLNEYTLIRICQRCKTDVYDPLLCYEQLN